MVSSLTLCPNMVKVRAMPLAMFFILDKDHAFVKTFVLANI